jgi:hypothetical protein
MKTKKVKKNGTPIVLRGDASTNEICQLGINALITKRILAFYSQLISNGQIKEVEIEGPFAIQPPSHCNQSDHMLTNVLSINLVPQQDDPILSNLNGHEYV